jgi:RNA polymerase sigma factor (TIGR02999 family)
MDSTPRITELLKAWGQGDQDALEGLVPLVESELRRLAQHYMRNEARDHLLQTTALVNEAFIRLVDQRRVQWQSRAHFYGIAAHLMRRILIDHARAGHAAKRGGQAQAVSLSQVDTPTQTADELLALDEALQRLASIDPRKSRVIELRYFGGLSVAEVAEVLDISQITVMRDWSMARAWLRREIETR